MQENDSTSLALNQTPPKVKGLQPESILPKNTNRSTPSQETIHPIPGTLPLFIPAWIRDFLPYLKGSALSVLIAYASHANRQGIAFPSVFTLQRETNYGRVSVKAGRRSLVKLGLLRPLAQQRSEEGVWGRKEFRMGWSLPGPQDTSAPADTPRRNGRPRAKIRAPKVSQGKATTLEGMKNL